MEFDRSIISTLPKSLHYFTRSLVLACNTLMKGKRISEKPTFVSQTEEFGDFLGEVSSKEGVKGIEKIREKVLKDVYDQNYTDVINKILEGGGKANDSFMSSGIELRVGKICLPVSEVYKAIGEHSKKKRTPHPVKILLGFYAVMYHTAGASGETKESLDLISDNINLMIDALEEMSRPPPSDGGFMGDLMSKFKGMDIGKVGEMLESLAQNPSAPPDLKNHVVKLQDVIKSDNPAEKIGEFLRETQDKMAQVAAQMKEDPEGSAPAPVPVEKEEPAPTETEASEQC